MSRLDRKRSHSIRLLLVGTATLISGCHTTPFVPDQADLYQSPDRDPNLPPGGYATEAACMDAVGADYCEPVVFDRSNQPGVVPFGERGPAVAVGYDEDENYQAQYLWPYPYPYGSQFVYWFSRGSTGIRSQVVRGGFGRSSARFGGAVA